MKLSEYASGPWLEHALYTASNRAIPSYIDGLKPVQRYLLAAGYDKAKNWIKTQALGSSVAEYGYPHGEQSAIGALQLLAADFRNNIQLFDGDGNFGNILCPEPSAARYTRVKLSKVIKSLFMDEELLEYSDDPEIKAPKYYLPIIPLVLANGISGIATGYATNIFPYNPINIIDILVEMSEGHPVTEPEIKLYNFKGKIKKIDSNKYQLSANYKIQSNKVIITDLPPVYTSESYETKLRALQDNGTITGYENNSSNDKFEYIVIFKRGTNITDKLVNDKLKISCVISQNLTVINENNKIREYNSPEELIQDFYNFRIQFIEKRIQKNIIDYELQLKYYTALIAFIIDVTIGKYLFKDKSEAEISDDLLNKYKMPVEFISGVLKKPIRYFSKNQIDILKQELIEIQKKLQYYKSTTKEIEYKKNLLELRNLLI